MADAERSDGTGKRARRRDIADMLRQRLSLGEFGKGTKLPALRQLASELDVSVMTVRSAIGILETEGWVRSIPTVGTFVQPPPRSDAATDTTIALSLEDLCSPFEVTVARSVDQACHEVGWGVQVFDARSNWEIDARNLGRLPKSSTIGGIVFPVHFGKNIDPLFELKRSGYPFVLIDRTVQGIDVDFVASDNEKGAYQAIEYLIRKGHRHILMVTDPPVVSTVIARIRGYERALIDHEITPQPDWKVWINMAAAQRGFEMGRRNAGGYLAALAAFRQMPRSDFPLAVFAHNDYVAWGVVDACREIGLRVPDDVSIICFDDSDVIQAMTPQLTCVAQRAGEIGKAAFALLRQRLTTDGRHAPPRHIEIPVDLIERASVATINKA